MGFFSMEAIISHKPGVAKHCGWHPCGRNKEDLIKLTTMSKIFKTFQEYFQIETGRMN